MKHLYCSFYYSVLIIIVFLFLFSSCGSKRDIVYFQNSENITNAMYAQDNTEFNTVILPNDNLFITVSAVNPEAVGIFNSGLLNRGSVSVASLDVFGYLVDQKGNINFPLVGEVHVAGLTKKDAILLLQKSISKFVADPIVNIRYLNYKVSIIGEVARPGVYTVTDEKISIPQAIAMAGDLTIYGNRHNVQLIRMVNGEKQSYFIDLTTPAVFFSPYYYLRQNDILYIAPNTAKASTSTYNPNIPLLMSSISLALTIITLIIRYK